MKFVNESNSKIKQQGIRCFPQQSYGVSSESPDYFKNKNTLIADFGYQYTLDDHKQKDKFEYFSQQHFINLGMPPPRKPSQQKNFINNFQKSSSTNSLAFHRRKGKMTEFLDKNSWMGNNYHLIGKERSQSARELSERINREKIDKKKE